MGVIAKSFVRFWANNTSLALINTEKELSVVHVATATVGINCIRILSSGGPMTKYGQFFSDVYTLIFNATTRGDKCARETVMVPSTTTEKRTSPRVRHTL